MNNDDELGYDMIKAMICHRDICKEHDNNIEIMMVMMCLVMINDDGDMTMAMMVEHNMVMVAMMMMRNLCDYDDD